MKRDRIETLKHNAKLDVRLPDQLKDEFLARCREEGVSSGAVIRSLMIDSGMAQPRRLPVMTAGLQETAVKRSKWIAGGIGGGVFAAMTAMSVVFAPVASADTFDLTYFIEVDRTGAHGVASGVAEFGDELYEFEVLDGDDRVSFRLFAEDCGLKPREHCAEGQALIKLDYEPMPTAEERSSGSVHTVVDSGAPAALGAHLPDGRTLSAVFTPILRQVSAG